MTDAPDKQTFSLTGLIYRILGAVVFIAILGGAWLVMEYRAFLDTPITLSEARIYHVRPGQSLRAIAWGLYEDGIIKHPRFWVWQGRRMDLANRIQAGEYELKPRTTPFKLLQQFSSGQVLQHTLTLVEGWDFKKMMLAITQHEALKHSLKDLPPEVVMERIGFPGKHPEGRFLPDTYHFARGTTDTAFLKRAYLAMSNHLADEWEAREQGLPLKTPYEALTLASIIEKETADESERTQIAGVFVRRLRKGMHLQTDPTVIYGMGDEYDGNIRYRDLRTDTPYNTYTRRGLPPTPIAMPGSAALYAALHPASGKSLYFVARGNGSHEFSDNLQAHNRAVAKYQLRRRQKSSVKGK